MLAIVEFAKFGNLRDYLRNKRLSNLFTYDLRKRMPTHINNIPSLTSSFILNSEREDEKIDFRDLLFFAYSIALGMDYLHSKKVIKTKGKRPCAPPSGGGLVQQEAERKPCHSAN